MNGHMGIEKMRLKLQQIAYLQGWSFYAPTSSAGPSLSYMWDLPTLPTAETGTATVRSRLRRHAKSPHRPGWVFCLSKKGFVTEARSSRSVAPRRILRRRKVRRPVRIIAPVQETGSPLVVNRPCPPLKLGRGVATYRRGKAARGNMKGMQNALKSEADEVEEIHTITLIMQLLKRSRVGWT